MKRLFAIPALLAVAGCTPQSVMTAWHWRDFIAHPDAGHYALLTDGLSGCAARACPAMADVSDAMIDDLTAIISARNLIAVQSGMRVYPLVKARGLVAVRLARRLAAVADENASIYLWAATAENFDDDVVVAIPAGMDGNYRGQYDLFRARRENIAAVTTPALRAARDKALARLDHDIAPLEDYVERGPRPIA